MEQRYETFTTQIAKISRCIKKIKGVETAAFDLKVPHVSCLYYLYKNGAPMTATNLCEVCDEDKGAISRAIDYLESHDYLTCTAEKPKRYNSPLTLTPRGIAMGQQIETRINAVLQDVSQTITTTELNTFYQVLSVISHNLQDWCDRYPKK